MRFIEQYLKKKFLYTEKSNLLKSFYYFVHRFYSRKGAINKSYTRHGLDLLVNWFFRKARDRHVVKNSTYSFLGNNKSLNKKIIFLQGSPVLEDVNGIKTGRLSGIVAHYTPRFLRKNTLPSWETNCLEDWEEKVEKVSKETLKEDMAAIGGIPPWVVMYFEKLLYLSGKKTVSEIFPSFSLFVYGGVNFSPYKNVFKNNSY